jgi:hypothetical protein
MQCSLLDQLIELTKADYPEDYARFCQLAYEIHRKFASPEEAARRLFSEACWLYRTYVSGSSEIAKLCEKFFEHLADVARDRGLVGRLEGDPEARPIPTDLITPEAFRFDPDLLVPPTHNGKLTFVDVRVKPAAAQLPGPSTAPVRKLSGKMWVPVAFERRHNELLQMSITDASCALHEESKTAPDCAKQLEARYIEKELRALGVFPKAFRGPKQRPK